MMNKASYIVSNNYFNTAYMLYVSDEDELMVFTVKIIIYNY